MILVVQCAGGSDVCLLFIRCTMYKPAHNLANRSMITKSQANTSQPAFALKIAAAFAAMDILSCVAGGVFESAGLIIIAAGSRCPALISGVPVFKWELNVAE